MLWWSFFSHLPENGVLPSEKQECLPLLLGNFIFCSSTLGERSSSHLRLSPKVGVRTWSRGGLKREEEKMQKVCWWVWWEWVRRAPWLCETGLWGSGQGKSAGILMEREARKAAVCSWPWFWSLRSVGLQAAIHVSMRRMVFPIWLQWSHSFLP